VGGFDAVEPKVDFGIVFGRQFLIEENGGTRGGRNFSEARAQ
jgi:hypothetical protein